MLLLISTLLCANVLTAYASHESNTTAQENGFTDISFANGYKGYCIDRYKKGAEANQSFTDKGDTAYATNNITGADISQKLKTLFTQCFSIIFTSNGNGGYSLNSAMDSPVSFAVYHFAGEQDYIWAENKALVQAVNAYAGPAIPDHGYQLKLENGDVITFDFTVLAPANTDTHQRFFAYKISVAHPAPHEHSYSKFWSSDETEHWHECECGDKTGLEEHKGEDGSCVSLPICEKCGEPFGATDPDNHTGNTEVRNVKEVSENEAGYTGDVYCKDCDALLKKGEIIPVVEKPKPEDNADLVIPETTSAIRKEAFRGNVKLQTVTIPKTVTYIGDHAFADCPNLKTITFKDRSNTKDISLGENWDGGQAVKQFTQADLQIQVKVKDVPIVKDTVYYVDLYDGNSKPINENEEIPIPAGQDTGAIAYEAMTFGRYRFVVKTERTELEGYDFSNIAYDVGEVTLTSTNSSGNLIATLSYTQDESGKTPENPPEEPDDPAPSEKPSEPTEKPSEPVSKPDESTTPQEPQETTPPAQRPTEEPSEPSIKPDMPTDKPTEAPEEPTSNPDESTPPQEPQGTTPPAEEPTTEPNKSNNETTIPTEPEETEPPTDDQTEPEVTQEPPKETHKPEPPVNHPSGNSASNTTAPKTGDSANMIPVFILMLVSGVMLCIATGISFRRRKQND